MPWTGVDATLTAAQTVVALQLIVARNVSLTQGMGVITVGKLTAGQMGNVMAGSASMIGSIRANSAAIRTKLLERIAEVADGTAKAAGAVAKTRLIEIYPVTVNDPKLTQQTVEALKEYGVDAKISDWNPGRERRLFVLHGQGAVGVHVTWGRWRGRDQCAQQPFAAAMSGVNSNPHGRRVGQGAVSRPNRSEFPKIRLNIIAVMLNKA